MTILFGLGLLACLVYLLYDFRKNNFSYQAYSKNIHVVTIAMVLFGALLGSLLAFLTTYPYPYVPLFFVPIVIGVANVIRRVLKS